MGFWFSLCWILFDKYLCGAYYVGGSVERCLTNIYVVSTVCPLKMHSSDPCLLGNDSPWGSLGECWESEAQGIWGVYWPSTRKSGSQGPGGFCCFLHTPPSPWPAAHHPFLYSWKCWSTTLTAGTFSTELPPGSGCSSNPLARPQSWGNAWSPQSSIIASRWNQLPVPVCAGVLAKEQSDEYETSIQVWEGDGREGLVVRDEAEELNIFVSQITSIPN